MSKERRSKQSPTKDRNVGCMKVKEWGQFELEKKYIGKKQKKPTVLIESADLCKLCQHGKRPLKKSFYFDGYQIRL